MKCLLFSLLLCGVSLSMGQMLENDPQGRACVPRSTFKDKEGCNTCVCTNDGARYACTKKFCVKTPDDVQSDEPMTCEPKSRFKSTDGCNWCTCSDDGKNSFCTLMACIDNPTPNAPTPYRRKRDDNCVPESTFLAQDGCNTCKCSADGTWALCTRMECPPKQEAKPYRKRRDTALELDGGLVCVPNSSFMSDCNVCICSVDGTRVYCTQRPCIRFP